jgi:hypothetical protein
LRVAFSRFRVALSRWLVAVGLGTGDSWLIEVGQGLRWGCLQMCLAHWLRLATVEKTLIEHVFGVDDLIAVPLLSKKALTIGREALIIGISRNN